MNKVIADQSFGYILTRKKAQNWLPPPLRLTACLNEAITDFGQYLGCPGEFWAFFGTKGPLEIYHRFLGYANFNGTFQLMILQTLWERFSECSENKLWSWNAIHHIFLRTVILMSLYDQIEQFGNSFDTLSISTSRKPLGFSKQHSVVSFLNESVCLNKSFEWLIQMTHWNIKTCRHLLAYWCTWKSH